MTLAWAILNSVGIAMELSGVMTVTITSIVSDRPLSNLFELLRTDPEKLDETRDKEMTVRQDLPLERGPKTMGEYYAMRRRYLKETLGAALLFFGLGLQLLASLFMEGVL